MGVRYFLRHEIYKFLSSVEVGIGMEGQIICIERCIFHVTSSVTGSSKFTKIVGVWTMELCPRPHWRRLQRSQTLQQGLRGQLLLRRGEGNGVNFTES